MLVSNLRHSLDVYQRSIVWSMTASAAFFLLAFRTDDPAASPVNLLYGELHPRYGWAVAFLLYLLLGGYALGALQDAANLLYELNPTAEAKDLIVPPSLLPTTRHAMFRIGTVLFCPLTVMAGVVVNVAGRPLEESFGEDGWSELVGLSVLIVGLYLIIVAHVWRPFGSCYQTSPNRKITEAT